MNLVENNLEIKKNILREMDEFASKCFEEYFIVLFGSFAMNKQKENSDIDIICFSKSFNNELLFKFKSFFLDLCEKYKISTRAQIPHERFLVITFEDLLKGISGNGFNKTSTELIIPERVHTTEFYSSDSMRFRFAFNSITTLNECISGNINHFQWFKAMAIEYLIGYIFILNDKKELSLNELVNATITDKKSNRSEGMFLGYKNFPEMREYLFEVYKTQLKILVEQNDINFDTINFKASENWLKKILNTNAEFNHQGD